MTNTPYTFGAKGDGLTDDTAACQRWADAGGGEIPAGNFAINGSIRFGSGFTISRWEGNLLLRRGSAIGFALCSKDWTSRTSGVRIDATARGQVLYTGTSDLPRKGIGLTYLDDFVLLRPTVRGGAALKDINLFSVEVRGSRKGLIRNGLLSILSGQQGSDGVHFTDYNSDITLQELEIISGDDSVGLTVEQAKFAGAIMERITLLNCVARNTGHSSLKALLLAIAGKDAVIRTLLAKNCVLETTLTQPGAGVPVWLENDAGTIDDVQIIGGRVGMKVPIGGLIGQAALFATGVTKLVFEPAEVDLFARQLAQLTDCPGAIINPGLINLIGRIPAPSRAMPLIGMTRCLGAQVKAGLKPAYAGQAIQ